MKMEMVFSGGLSVAARFKGHEVLTDQPVRVGGDDKGPAPFDLFLASIGTCMAFYALQFCRMRQIDTEGLEVSLETRRNRDTGMVERIDVDLGLPPDFPDKYVSAVVRSMNQCAVKRHMQDPPEFQVAPRIVTPA